MSANAIHIFTLDDEDDDLELDIIIWLRAK